MLQSAPKHFIFILKIQKFYGERAQPPPQTLPTAGGGHVNLRASIFVPSALTHAPPTRKSGNRMTFSDLAEFRRHGASCVSAHLSLLLVRVSRL